MIYLRDCKTSLRFGDSSEEEIETQISIPVKKSERKWKEPKRDHLFVLICKSELDYYDIMVYSWEHP